MLPSTLSRRDRDLTAIPSDPAGVAVEVESIRIERLLARKDRSDEPRAPAGQSEGRRWVSDGSGGRDPGKTDFTGQAESRTEEAVTEDGSRVLSIRIRADPARTGTSSTPSPRPTARARCSRPRA